MTNRPIRIIASCAAILVFLGYMMFASRHWLISAAPAIGGNFSFCYAAPQMAPRAIAFRQSFVKNYYTPENPYPVFTAMYQSQMAPSSHQDEISLGNRGPFVFSGPNLLVNDASKSGNCLPGSICSSAVFPVTLAGSTYSAKVDFAPLIQVKVNNGSALTFDFGPGIPFHVQNPGSSGIPLMRPDMFFNSVSVSDTAIDEVVSNPGTGQGDALSITVHLDLVNSTCPASGGMQTGVHQ